MKIGFPVNHTDLNARVEDKMSSAAFLLVMDMDDMTFETVPAQVSAGPGAGIRAIALLLEMDAQVLMVGYMAGHIAQTLNNKGIEVVTGVQGSVKDVVEQYRNRLISSKQADHLKTDKTLTTSKKIGEALRKTLKQFFTMVPVLAGIIFLMGPVQGMLSENLVLSVFSGSPFKDTILGAFMGSLFAGNPINSYVIGRSLLELGAGFFGICALMMSWVAVGVVQLPAEIAALGYRFALVRNIAAFFIAILASILVVILAGVI